MIRLCRRWSFSCSKCFCTFSIVTNIFECFIRLISNENFIVFQDDKKARERKRMSNDNVLEFRRRHSALESNDQSNSSIILRPSIFRRNFRPSSLQPHDYVKRTRKKIRIKLFEIFVCFCCCWKSFRRGSSNTIQSKWFMFNTSNRFWFTIINWRISSIISNYYVTWIGRYERKSMRILLQLKTYLCFL